MCRSIIDEVAGILGSNGLPTAFIYAVSSSLQKSSAQNIFLKTMAREARPNPERINSSSLLMGYYYMPFNTPLSYLNPAN